MTDRDRRLPLLRGWTMARRLLEATRLFVPDQTDRALGLSPAGVPPFHEIYRDYFDFVWSTAARCGVEPSARDDVVQEVFIVINSRLHTLQNPKALRSWIYGVVRRTASSYRRARRTQAAAGIEIGIDVEPRSQEPTPFEQTQKNAELELLAALMAELDEPKREVFALVEIDELTVPEVARLLKLPLNTAYSRLRLARQAFEAALLRHEARSKGTGRP